MTEMTDKPQPGDLVFFTPADTWDHFFYVTINNNEALWCPGISANVNWNFSWNNWSDTWTLRPLGPGVWVVRYHDR